MADVHEPEIRSYNMSRIRSKNTKPEIVIRKFLHAHGFRYGLHNKKLPGKPDLVLRKYKTVIFVHGCFWHGHEGCRYYVIPQTRTQWWIDKINRNKENDRKHYEELKDAGWNIIVVWECELKKDHVEQTLNKLPRKIRKGH